MSLGNGAVAGARRNGRARGRDGCPAQPDRKQLTGRRNALPSAITRAARPVLVAARRPGYRSRMLPGFLIAGAARCGTTSMFEALSQHPAVFNAALLPWTKEVHYFDNNYDRGLAWYQCHFPPTARARLSARRAGTAPVAFESGPSYMFHPLAPERINRDLPGVKLLVLLRDPVERAYSAHANRVSSGCENEPFARALELEDARLEGEVERMLADPVYVSHSYRHHAYRTRGQYADQLERLERIFGRDRIHVIDSGDFFADPGPVYDQVLDFLGLPRRGHPLFGRHNARPRSAMPETVRAALEEHFRPYDERLTAWLGHEPSWERDRFR